MFLYCMYEKGKCKQTGVLHFQAMPKFFWTVVTTVCRRTHETRSMGFIKVNVLFSLFYKPRPTQRILHRRSICLTCVLSGQGLA